MHFIDLNDFSQSQILKIIDKSIFIKNLKKEKPQEFHKGYGRAMKGKTLLMLFEKPSLRTRVSFEVGMTLLGGHAIYYNISTSPLGKKESISDFAKVSSRYVEIVMARLFKHSDILELAEKSSVPVINALTNFSHPCQIMADLMTIVEKRGKLEGLKLAYLGDSFNNVTHSLLHGCVLTGMDISVGCPDGKDYEPDPQVVKWAKEQSGKSASKVVITHDAMEAVKDADFVYTDSWMSYHVDPSQEAARVKLLKPYQVNEKLMSNAKPDALFMNCLPAMREYEQTAEVIDGPQSIVFDEAENRLYAQIGIMLELLGIE
jgi:ornithine carbamoyltransferase